MNHRGPFGLILFCVAASCLVLYTSQAGGQVEEPSTEDEIPVDPRRMPDHVLDQLKSDPFVKEHFGWKLAFCQHPMYLLIDEDRGEPTVGERVPPWGARDKEGYVGRVRRNLQSLEELPELKLNYQWSAVELQSMCQSFPDVHAWIKKLYQNGSLDFLDGTYSQAHLHVLGAESNWRQFEYGLEVYRDLFDKKVDVYARQETGVHIQLPQLLRLFGYKFAALPDFHAVLEFVDGGFKMIKKHPTYKPVAGDEFVDAVGLDGSRIPTYLLAGGEPEDELQRDLYSGPKIFYSFPDLEEVDRETYEDYHSLFDWVLLRDALIERYKAAPPSTKAEVYSYWSYIEGVWAEELMRKMRSAEEAAVLAEQSYCMGRLAGLPVDKSDEIKEIWKAILKSQHHDISWIEVTDLRRKSINRLGQTIDSCNEMMAEIAKGLLDEDDNSIAIFNGLPRERRRMVELEGGKALGTDSRFQEFKGKSIGFVNVPAGGFKSFEIAENAPSSKETPLPEKIQTDHYSIELSKQGLIEQITARNGKNLLSSGDYLGGEIRARIAREWVDNRTAECTYYSGEVCDILERSTSLGEIPLFERYYFFKNEPIIKGELEFDFDGNEVGYMWIDKTKINVYYPTADSDLYHDIPFGYLRGEQSRPLFATSWLYSGGLVYVNRGTVKHWVEDEVIANVLGWGSNHFSNRLHWDWLESAQYDIRLYGKQKIEYYLIPYGEFDGQRIVADVSAITSPLFTCKGKGEKSLYEIKDEALAVTCVYEQDGQVWARGYKLPSDDKSKYRDWEIFNTPINDVN